MAARADDDDSAAVHSSEAVVLCLMECNEIYLNLMDSDTQDNNLKLKDMGKTLRVYAHCLAAIGANDAASETLDDVDLYEAENAEYE
ncbi:hypothetical protein [Methylomonas albis]|uniref:Uncharacterized protein n=1 Tax=Methylomonas albis TaxID=1854563 RepID=A0ABR9CVH1_9GAMM|nr:hypothetical protein [Methylomonas albis]MBD9354814.1 hypothetical protein [Methylomonas albis]